MKLINNPLKVDGLVANLCNLFKEHKGLALVAGGAVRDHLLLNTPKDYDIEVYGLPMAEIKEILTKAEVDWLECGESFSVLKIRNAQIDISLPRRERKTGEKHTDFVVEADPNMSIEEACSRRDFTINAMLYDPLTMELHDPHGGYQDLLTHGVLRHTSVRFLEDHLRVLRGMQFLARFPQLSPHHGTIEICKTMSMEHLSAERIFGEFNKMLLEGLDIKKGLEFLRDVNWLRFFPELLALIGVKQDPDHHPEGDVFTHLGYVMNAFAMECRDSIPPTNMDRLLVGYALLCHDLGKATTTSVGEDGKIHAYGHEGELHLTNSFMMRLTNEKELLEHVPKLVQYHMAVRRMFHDRAGRPALRRLFRNCPKLAHLLVVSVCDTWGRPTPPKTTHDNDISMLKAEEWFSEQVETLEINKASIEPILKGRHLLELQVTPGPEMGKLLAQAMEAQLDEVFTDLSGAIAYAKEHLIKPATPA